MKNILFSEPWPPLAELLTETTQRLGLPSMRADKTTWKSHADYLYPTTKELVLTMVASADSLLDTSIAKLLVVEGGTWPEPGPGYVTMRLRPHDEYYLRTDEPHRRPPPWQHNTGIGIEFELLGAHESSVPDYYIQPRLLIKLSVGYLHIAPFRWLMAQWRRPLIGLVQPLEFEVFDNGFQLGLPNANAKRYHGKDVLKKIENYLFISEGDENQVFYIERTLVASTHARDIALVFAALLAVFDSLYHLSIPRCDPDRLHRHYLKLRPYLPQVPFRDSFYAKV